MTSRLIVKLLALLLVLAERDAAKALARDQKYRKQQAAKAKVLAHAAHRARLKAADLSGEATRCDVAAGLGSRKNLDARMDAVCLAAGLKSVISQPHKS